MMKLKSQLILSFLVFSSIMVAQAQPGGGGDPGGGEPVPIQGLWILLVAGATMAVKTLFPKNKSNS